MERWESEPYWQTLDRLQLQTPVAITAGDVLVVVVRERSQLPRLARTPTTFKNLDVLKSKMGQGEYGIIIRS
jgi:hypothetical protein